MSEHEQKLDRLAELAVRVGVRIQPGQQLVLTAPIEAAPLVRRIAGHAYRAGCSLVTPIFSDEGVTRERFLHAREDSFDAAAGWMSEAMAQAFREGAARMAVAGADPDLLSDIEPGRVARANRAASKSYRPVLELITGFAVNWSIVPYATASWARAVFPGVTEAEAQARLWEAVFAATRADREDAVAAWDAHNAALHARTQWLDGLELSALRFRGPGTALTVGLSDGHRWLGGAKAARNGVTCNPNLPTEEVYTTPHRLRVEGTVCATKPLSHAGTLIEDIAVRFEEGRVVEAHARTGEAVLRAMLDTDEGARRLGEVALVPDASPISRSGLLFRNTLFDENAASHIALGQAYSNALRGSEGLDAAALGERGANASLIHVDWMIGSGAVDVDGLREGGGEVAVMRAGAWAG